MKEALCFVTILSSLAAIFGFIEAENGGLSMDLIRRQSPHSPHYNTSSNVESPLKPDEVRASYLMTLKVGTAPVEISASADTGSSLIWTQCSSTKQHKTPPFDPTKSSTYKVEAFGSEACREAPGNSRGSKNECNYTQQYGKGSASGVLATDTFVFDSTDGKAPVPFVKSVFGCTLDDEAQLGSDEGGVAGLGPGPLSLVSQFSKVNIKRIFSYCFPLPDTDRHIKLRFGTTAKISGNGIVSTPIEKDPLHYPITLEAITIGGKYKLPLTPLREGNMVIDSGTTLTYLKPKFYAQVVKAVQNVVQETLGLEPVPDEKYLCYSTDRLSEFPDMIFHFAGEADITLKPLNTFFPNGPAKYCMAISPPPGRATPSTFGNWAQVNLQVEYDLENMKLSFAPFSTRCYTD